MCLLNKKRLEIFHSKKKKFNGLLKADIETCVYLRKKKKKTSGVLNLK